MRGSRGGGWWWWCRIGWRPHRVRPPLYATDAQHWGNCLSPVRLAGIVIAFVTSCATVLRCSSNPCAIAVCSTPPCKDSACRIALGDFGTAWRLEDGERLMMHVGTPSHWAPELYKGDYGLQVRHGCASFFVAFNGAFVWERPFPLPGAGAPCCVIHTSASACCFGAVALGLRDCRLHDEGVVLWAVPATVWPPLAPYKGL